MKIRNGFVSNSSSSSFVISKRYVSAYQLDLIQNHIEYIEPECEKGEAGCLHPEWGWPTCRACRAAEDHNRNRWRITVDGGNVEGYTDMDNFDMAEFLENIGVPMEKVEWWHS